MLEPFSLLGHLLDPLSTDQRNQVSQVLRADITLTVPYSRTRLSDRKGRVSEPNATDTAIPAPFPLCHSGPTIAELKSYPEA